MFATLGFNELVRVPSGMERTFAGLRSWRIVEGDRRYRGWRATFYVTGMEHSKTSTTGSAWEPTPWKAVQRAAARTLDRIERSGRAA